MNRIFRVCIQSLGVIIITSCILSPMIAQDDQQQCPQDDYFTKFEEAMMDENYEYALEIAGCLIQLAPNSTYPYSLTAMIYARLGDYEMTLSFAEQAIAIDYSNGSAHQISAFAHFSLRNYQACIQAGESALVFNMFDMLTYFTLMRCYDSEGMSEEKLNMANELLNLANTIGYADAYFYRAYAYYELGQFENAYNDIQTAIRESRARIAVDFEIQAQILLALDNPLLAYASIERARLLDSRSPIAFHNIYEQIRMELKIQQLDLINATFFENTQPLYEQRFRALELLNQQDYDVALTEFDEWMDIPYGLYAEQYITAMMAYTSLLNNQFREHLNYSDDFILSTNLRDVVSFLELPSEPIIIPTGFWTGGAYRFTVRPNQTYTFIAETADSSRFIDPYIVILHGTTPMVVMGVGDDAEVDGRVEYTFTTDTPGQYVIFVGGFGLAYGDIRLSYTETR